VKQRQRLSVFLRNPSEVYHRKGINSMVVSPISTNESYLFSASRDRLIKLWHIDYEKKLHHHIADLDSHTDWVNQIMLIPEARNTVVSCSNDTTIKIWRMDDLKKVKQKRIKPFSTL
jgi:WD40 repeat protein